MAKAKNGSGSRPKAATGSNPVAKAAVDGFGKLGKAKMDKIATALRKK